MERRQFLREAGGTLAAATTTSVAGCISDLANSPTTILGAFPGPQPTTGSILHPFERWLGCKPAVLTLYYDAIFDSTKSNDIRAQLTRAWKRGHVPMLTWQPYPKSHSKASSEIEQQILSGAYDSVIDRWADLLSNWSEASDESRRLYFRPFPEMNTTWVPWSAANSGSEPSDFVDAWAYVHDSVMDRGLTRDQIQWVWNPNATDDGKYDMESYYPGDDLVDWVALDGYNFGTSKSWSTWQSPKEIFGPGLGRLRSLTDKPVAIPEFGSSSKRGDSHDVRAKDRWISDAFDFVRDEEVRLTAWFNVDKETDWAVFGGARGTGTYETGSNRYHVYESYKRHATASDVIASDGTSGRVLSDEVFRGTF